jgi:hypothetical protein
LSCWSFSSAEAAAITGGGDGVRVIAWRPRNNAARVTTARRDDHDERGVLQERLVQRGAVDDGYGHGYR